MTTQAQTKGVMGQIGRIREQVGLFVEQELKRKEIHGILPAHAAVFLFLFEQNEPVAMKEIVEQIGRVKSTVTGMVNTLEHHGYVEKTQSHEDGRVMLVQLSDKGWSIRPAFEKILDRVLIKIYGDMPDEDRQTLLRLLTQVVSNLEK